MFALLSFSESLRVNSFRKESIDCGDHRRACTDVGVSSALLVLLQALDFWNVFMNLWHSTVLRSIARFFAAPPVPPAGGPSIPGAGREPWCSETPSHTCHTRRRDKPPRRVGRETPFCQAPCRSQETDHSIDRLPPSCWCRLRYHQPTVCCQSPDLLD